ncbi:MAG: hypothetical protein AB7W47_12120 [Calditrichaceae bacterium]
MRTKIAKNNQKQLIFRTYDFRTKLLFFIAFGNYQKITKNNKKGKNIIGSSPTAGALRPC